MVDRFEKFSFSIFEIYKCWHKITAEEMEKYELKGSYSTYLTTLYRYRDGLTAVKLGSLCGKDKADVSRAVATMEQKGIVKKQGGQYRARIILTEKGLEAAQHIRSRAAVAVDIAGKDLSDEHREILYKSLDSIAENLHNICQEGIPE